MSVDQVDQVDLVGVDKDTGEVVLTITDQLDWSQSLAHQTVLQTKLNRYLAFVESGEILKKYPDAKGRRVVFDVVFKFRPDSEGRQFLDKVQKIIESAGVRLRCSQFADSYDN